MERRWRRGALALGMVISLAGVPAAASGQSEAAADPLAASLLTVEDLPPGLAPQGVDEPPRFDIDDASFAATDGQRAIGQVWAEMDTTPLVVFDFRMQLPDAAAAAAYLDAAEPILSEAEASGLAPVMFGEPIGEDGRYYFGVQEVEGSEIQLHNFLFHVGPIAAKVFIAGSDIEEGLPALVAQAAVDRISASLEGASSSPDTSALPGGSPSPSGSMAAGPLGELLAHVPPGVRDTCDESDVEGSEIAVVVCSPPGGPPAIYALYGNGIAVDGDFATITGALPTPRAETCAEGPFLGTYEVEGEVVGQLACWTDESGASLLASDKRIPMMVFLLSDDQDLAALAQALNELAPLP